MKKFIYIYAITVLFILFVKNEVIAQPKFIINAFGGYGIPLGDFKTDVPTTERADADWFPYYTKQLINFGVDGKLAIGKAGNFRAVFGLTYNMFSNNVDALLRTDTSNGGVNSTVNFKPKVNIISVFLGGEWAFMPKGKINPYVGAAIVGNFFGGSFTFGQNVFVKGVLRTGPMDMKAETRIGFLFDAGVDFKINKNFGVNAGVKYHLINPLGKGADDPSEIGPNEIDLGDMAHKEDNTTFAARSISSFNGYIGVSFYFGAPKKMK